MAWSTISPVNIENAASGTIWLMAVYRLASRLKGESHLWSPLGPAFDPPRLGLSVALFVKVSARGNTLVIFANVPATDKFVTVIVGASSM